MPFFGLEYTLPNQSTPCCLIDQNADIQKIQSTMLSGSRPLGCKKCWNLEDKGIVSDRQLKNAAYDFYANKDIRFVEQDCKEGKFSKQIIKLYTSNLCNSACVTCGPNYSTKWQTLKNIKIVKNELPDETLNTIDWKNIKMLSFVGGEPLYEKKNLKILENLVSLGNTDCFISLVTNGSVTLTPIQENLFKNFKNLNICLSIDGIGKKFEYIRYPLKWETLLDNIQKYKDIGANVSVSFTVSNLNILYYDQIINWFKDNNLNYNHNLVLNPEYFNIDVLPVQVKKNLPLVKYPDMFDQQLFDNFVSNIELQDKIKNISIKDYLPELSEVIDKFRKN